MSAEAKLSRDVRQVKLRLLQIRDGAHRPKPEPQLKLGPHVFAYPRAEAARGIAKSCSIDPRTA